MAIGGNITAITDVRVVYTPSIKILFSQSGVLIIVKIHTIFSCKKLLRYYIIAYGFIGEIFK